MQKSVEIKLQMIIQLIQDPSYSLVLDLTTWPLLQQNKNIMDYRISVRGKKEKLGSGSGATNTENQEKHTFCTVQLSVCQVFILSLFYHYIENKLFVVTVPDRHDLTWLNTINCEGICCGVKDKRNEESNETCYTPEAGM